MIQMVGYMNGDTPLMTDDLSCESAVFPILGFTSAIMHGIDTWVRWL